MERKGRLTVLLLFLVCCFISPAICVIKCISFTQNCEGFLKQAADASNPEIALERIDKAISYIEAKNLTSGYTSIVIKTEDENVEFWYRNIVACKKELQSCLEASQLERTNVLMKVRESLTDNGEKGTILTVPDGISRHPHNLLWAIWNTISGIALLITLFFFAIELKS